MLHSITRYFVLCCSLIVGLFFAISTHASAQTFRGAITGAVTDPSGAALPGAQVAAVETATGISYKSESSSAGEFAFTNLPVGDYTVTVSAPGFSTVKFNKVTVSAGGSYTLPVTLGMAKTQQTIEVTASQLTLDTVTDVQSSDIPEAAVQTLPNSGRDFTQMLALNAGFAGYSTGGGALASSVNGTRSNSVNWQIEGTDNNDLWWNIPAVNQSGVNGIAAVIMPMDAIESFSFTTSGTTEIGRNSGGTANVIIKSGTNSLHGSAYYLNHNEFFQANNPFETSKQETRNQHYGFSVGAPIRRDKTFFFVSGEHQWFDIGAGGRATEPSAAYQTEALAILSAYGMTENPVAHNLLYGNGSLSALWPAAALTGPASPLNYSANGITTGYSYNGVGKIDEHLTDKDHIAFTYFIGQGIQTAPVSSELTPYFQQAGTHIQNYSLVYDRVLSPTMANQLSAGVSYFQQVFADADTAFDPIGLGLDTGATIGGSPHLVIGTSADSGGLNSSSAGFDPIGVTPPLGRTDITGHLDEDLTWTRGAHQLHFGGEYRKAQVHEFYLLGERGNIFFDGTQGPWAALSGGTPGAACAALATETPSAATTSGFPSDPNVYYLADFLAGCFDPSVSNITQGDPRRLVYVNSFAYYGQDTWQTTKKLSLNYGLRFDYEGPVHTGEPNLSVFDPSLASGLAVTTQQVPNIYSQFWGGYSPRVGFSYQIGDSARTVMRGGYGLYYDSIYMKSILEDENLQTGADFGPELNPAGNSEVATASALNTTIQSGVPFYETYDEALAGAGITTISTFAKNFRTAYTQTYDLNIEQQFGPAIMWQLGYVGTKGTHLLGVSDINQGALNSLNVAVPYDSETCPPQYSGAAPPSSANPSGTPGNDLQCSRPYFSQFPNFGSINEENTNLGSIYNSLQTSLRLQSWHSLGGQLVYTWGHAIDYETGALPYLPQNSLDEAAERGNSDFDVRQTLSGYVNYAVPAFLGQNRLSKGWELTSQFSFHGGTPYTATSATNPSGNGESADRALQVLSDPNNVPHGISAACTCVQWFNPSAFVDAAPGTYSPTRRGQNYNPGYDSVDLTVLKSTTIHENISAQFRADMINIFDHTNLAPLGWPTASDAGGEIGSTIGPFLGDPGIGPGEPFNVQFTLKILF
jgi:Carboxypeptidase regulatory-like domain/TonB dependent receptor